MLKSNRKQRALELSEAVTVLQEHNKMLATEVKLLARERNELQDTMKRLENDIYLLVNAKHEQKGKP